MDLVIDYFLLILQFHVSLCWDDVSINIRIALDSNNPVLFVHLDCFPISQGGWIISVKRHKSNAIISLPDLTCNHYLKGLAVNFYI